MVTRLRNRFKKRPKSYGLVVVLIGGYLCLKIAALTSSASDQFKYSKQFKSGKFSNLQSITSPDLLPILRKYWIHEAVDNEPAQAIPVKPIEASQITELPSDRLSVIKFGHSTALVKIAGQLWLIDPVFSERASPFGFFGPRRFHPPPIEVDALPAVQGVIISHNHYDHLDEFAIKSLKAKTKLFMAPLGLADKLISWGVTPDKIIELDWWQSHKVGDVVISSTPAQHFSGRGVFDRNNTLWSSWVLKSKQFGLFYSGDSGYFPGFKEIGKRLGPFDIALLEIGAYDELWPLVHMFPEQALQANQDLNSRNLMPVHNGTFDLAFHAWYEPLERISVLGRSAEVSVVTPIVGEIITIDQQQQATQGLQAWWRDLP